jgi:hypothetical protein
MWGVLSKLFGSTAKGTVEGLASGAGDFMKDVKEIITGDMEPEKKAEYVLKNAQMMFDWGLAEARHKSIFVAGWRPFIGWVLGIALLYSLLLHPVFLWLNQIYWHVPNPPVLDTAILYQILTGMLGLAGIRSYDKNKGKG